MKCDEQTPSAVKSKGRWFELIQAELFPLLKNRLGYMLRYDWGNFLLAEKQQCLVIRKIEHSRLDCV